MVQSESPVEEVGGGCGLQELVGLCLKGVLGRWGGLVYLWEWANSGRTGLPVLARSRCQSIRTTEKKMPNQYVYISINIALLSSPRER